MSQHMPPTWTGRDDGPGPSHRRWHSTVRVVEAAPPGPGLAIVGFASDEGVRRNGGRPGARQGPKAIRAALGSIALHADVDVVDLGDVAVVGEELEAGQAAAGELIAAALAAGRTPLVLGGGHEIAWASYLGLRDSVAGRRLGILNLDAHFDLREAPAPSSGTPFRQIAADRGADFEYAVVGIAEASNTPVLFEAARELGVRYLLDEQSQERHLAEVLDFVADFVAGVDALYLTIDLDALPAAVAPGVSAPAAYGVPTTVVLEVVRAAAASGKLLLADVAELNPDLDLDSRTARLAARLLHTIATTLTARPEDSERR